MNYSALKYQEFFSCKVKNTYVDIHVFTSEGFIKVLSLLKSDYPDIIGYGEQTLPSGGLVPITLTDDTINFIVKKYNGIGSVILDNTVIKDANALQMQEQANNQFVVSPELNNTNPVVPKEQDNLTMAILTYIATTGLVFVPQSQIDCEAVPEDEVVVEEVETEEPQIKEDDFSDDDTSEEEEEEVKPKKDYSKLIWTALAALALAL